VSVVRLFPTLIYSCVLKTEALRRELLHEIGLLQEIDDAGHEWSKTNYVGGYTSYSSETQLHHTSPHFGELARMIRPKVKAYCRQLGSGKDRLEFTDMWVNVMPPGAHHSGHIHPGSVISGTFYVSVPAKSASITFEDPRLPFLMNAPSRDAHYSVQPKNNGLVLFESWLRHEVKTQTGNQPRISVSFNLA
jgi:uncharacterized protein (TIGR02466 family)